MKEEKTFTFKDIVAIAQAGCFGQYDNKNKNCKDYVVAKNKYCVLCKKVTKVMWNKEYL